MFRIIIIPFILLLASCAQIVSPAGGPIDSKPPVAIEYLPDSAATEIKPSRIRIRFNEYVQLKDLTKEFVVSPSLKNIPDVTASGKIVTVEISDTLEDNTTYVVDFGKSIADITELNSTPFRYIFSTGKAIDTLVFSGKIENALTQKPEPDFTVMLYKSLNDSAPYKNKPYYYARASKEGSFVFTNLKPGTYKVFALKDDNGNFFPDPEEPIAFAMDPVTLTDTNVVRLQSFVEEPFRHYLKKSEVIMPGKLVLSYSKTVGDIELSQPDTSKLVSVYDKEYSNQKDSLTIWYKDAKSDSIVFIAKSEFTSDTIELRITGSKKRNQGNPFTISTSELEGGQIFKDEPVFTVTAPLDSINTSLITLKRSSETDSSVSVRIDTLLKKTFTLKESFVIDTMNTIVFLPGALKFYNGQTNDTIKKAFFKRPADVFGTLYLKLEDVSESGIVEITNEAGLLKGRMFTGPGKDNEIFLEKLEPGNYKARLIIDANNNLKWDTGNYIQKRQPEKVIILDKDLPVKAGWDLEEFWDAGSKEEMNAE